MKITNLDAEIARLVAMKEASEKMKALLGDDLERLRELDAKSVAAKNVAGENTGTMGSIWELVYGITTKIHDATTDSPETREQMFVDALDEFMNPPIPAGVDKVKVTTAGQYASTARKLLVKVTEAKADIHEFDGKSVKDVRQSFKAADMLARLETAAGISKELRFIAKYGKADDLIAISEAVRVVYNPIKAARDAKSKKGEAAKAIPELQQQAPAEAGTVETVAAELADAGEEKPQAVAQAA